MDCLAFYLTSESESNLLTLRYAHTWLMKCQGLISDKHLLKYGLEHTPRLLLAHQVIPKLRGVKPPLLFMNPKNSVAIRGNRHGAMILKSVPEAALTDSLLTNWNVGPRGTVGLLSLGHRRW